MRISPTGQVTIPPELRERCGMQPGTEVEFDTVEGGLLLRATPTADHSETPEERRARARELREFLEKWPGVDWGMTTDEFMDAIRGPFEELEESE